MAFRGTMLAVAVVLAGSLLAPRPSVADGITTQILFQTQNQSELVGDSQGSVTVTAFDQPPQNFGGAVQFGSIDDTQLCAPDYLGGGCVDTGSYGMQVKAVVSGFFHTSMTATADAGSVAAQVPVDVSLGYNPTTDAAGHFSINSSGMFQPGASLATSAMGASVNLTAQAGGFGALSVEACAVDCTTNSVSFPTSASLSQTLSLPTTGSFSKGVFTGTVSNPLGASQTTNSGTQDASSPLVLSSDDTSNFMSLSGNITADEAMTGLAGSYNIGVASVNYSLLSAGTTVSLAADQKFALTATPEVSYILNYTGAHNETKVTGPMSVNASYKGSLPTGETAVTVTPVYTMVAALSNEITLTPIFDLNLGAITFDISVDGVGSLNEGPLYSLDKSWDLPSFDLFNYSGINLGGWNSSMGQSFKIAALQEQAPPPGNPSATPEPATVLLFGTGLLLGAGLLRRRSEA